MVIVIKHINVMCLCLIMQYKSGVFLLSDVFARLHMADSCSVECWSVCFYGRKRCRFPLHDTDY